MAVVVELVGYIIIALKKKYKFFKKTNKNWAQEISCVSKWALVFQKFEVWILQLENSNPKP